MKKFIQNNKLIPKILDILFRPLKLYRKKSLSPKTLSIFYRQLAQLSSAKMTWVEVFEILREGAEPPLLQQVIDEIHNDLKKGSTLSECLLKQNKYIDPIAQRLISVGEKQRSTKKILNMLADYYDRTAYLQQLAKRRVFLWPVINLIVIGILVFIESLLSVPVFRKLFEGSGMKLPFITESVVAISLAFRILLPILIIILILNYLKKWVRLIRIGSDWLLLRIPLFGKQARQIGVEQFTRTLAISIKSKLSMVDALDMASASVSNKALARKFIQIRYAVSLGASLSEAMSKCKEIPLRITQIVRIAEKSNALVESLNMASEFYGDVTTEALIFTEEIFRYLVIIIIGILVGYIVIGLYLPVFMMASAF
jgi:type IV pilus assembly protein PilC